MATQTEYLMGEIIDDPENEKKDVQMLLASFLDSLLKEQQDQSSLEQL